MERNVDMIDGRVRFFGHSAKEVSRAFASLIIEDKSTSPAILTLQNVVAVPEAPALYDTNGYMVTDAMRIYYPADLMGDKSYQACIAKQRKSSPIQIKLPDYDIYENEAYFAGIFIAHYGHFLVDGLSRLWALNQFPDHPVLFSVPTFDPHSIRDLSEKVLPYIGLDLSRRVPLQRATMFRSLICPIPTLQYVHRAFHQHARVAERLSAAYGIVADDEEGRFYLSRSRLPFSNRHLSESELESRLERYGYQVIYPETLTLRDQISLFSGRRTIVGSRGSAFHTTLFAPPGSRSTLAPIGWDRIDGHYLLIDGIKEHESIYINSAELTPQTNGTRFNVTLNVECTLDLMSEAGLL